MVKKYKNLSSDARVAASRSKTRFIKKAKRIKEKIRERARKKWSHQ